MPTGMWLRGSCGLLTHDINAGLACLCDLLREGASDDVVIRASRNLHSVSQLDATHWRSRFAGANIIPSSMTLDQVANNACLPRL